MYFQNKINEVSKADYYAYRLYRENIQNSIDKKIELILRDTWNKEEEYQLTYTKVKKYQLQR